MCRFFSWAYSPSDKRVLYRVGAERFYDLSIGENPDSHAYLAEAFGIDEDKTAKFEFEVTPERAKEILELDNDKFVDKLISESEYDGGVLGSSSGTSPLEMDELSNGDIEAIRTTFTEDVNKVKEVIKAYALDLGAFDNNEVDVKQTVKEKLLKVGDGIVIFRSPVVVGFLKTVPHVKDKIPYHVRFLGDNEEVPILTIYNYIEDWDKPIAGRVYLKKFLGTDKYTGEDVVRKELRILVKNLIEV